MFGDVVEKNYDTYLKIAKFYNFGSQWGQSADDIVQYALTKAWEKYDVTIENLGGWLRGFVVYTAKAESYRGIASKMDKRVAPLETADKLPSVDIAVQANSWLDFHAAMNQLDPLEQRAVILADMFGHTGKDAAFMCKVPYTTYIYYLRRGRAKLRELLK